MTILTTVTKQVSEVQEYTKSFSTILAGFTSVTISTCTATASPSGLTVSASISGENIKIRYSVGVNNYSYKVTILTTLSNGLVYEDELYVDIEDL
jgi:hypothetical protein